MMRCLMIRSGVFLPLLLVVLVAGSASSVLAQATSVTSTGFRATEGGGGALTTDWVTGNLGNTWSEGEWVPYQLIISNVQTDYPGLVGFPTITMSYDFTGGGDKRFVDLVRSIQAGTTQLTDLQGWVRDDGSAYPMTTRSELEAAQNDFGNNPPRENTWPGFTLLNLPDTQMNRAPDLSVGTPTDAEHVFYITLQDLLDAGIPTDADTVIIYYQLHESRSFVWENSLQEYYCDGYTPGTETDDWGGYLYCLPAYADDVRLGAGYVPGSSGHIEVEFGGGAKTVPIPIPEQLPGAVSGLKWLDENGDAIMNGSEMMLSGWPVYVTGMLEGIAFSDTAYTDGSGNYSFPNLTSGVTWTIKEASRSDSGYIQTYPYSGASTVGVGTPAAVLPPPPGVADWGWNVALTLAMPNQADMNFGNLLCQITITCPPDDTVDCNGSTDPSSTGYPTVDANCPPVDTTYSDVTTPGDCDVDGYLYYIARTWVVTDEAGNADTCVQYIYVVDTTAPVISCPTDQTYECDASWSFGTPTATDDCDNSVDISILSTDTLPGTCPENFEVTRTWVATDDCGNADTCSQTITIQDTTPPVITCPTDRTFECDAIGAFGVATATDNCDADPSVNLVDTDTIPGSCESNYQIVRTFVATDNCGNADTCSQTITIQDTTPPVITCPSDKRFECDAVGSFGTATATDNCDASPTITYSDDTTSLSCPLHISRMYVATDDCGNADTCYQSITIDDTTPPVISCPTDRTFECDNIGAFGTATATDNCTASPSVNLVDTDTIPGSCESNYQITRMFVATDDCGNADTCTQTITIQDTTPPVVTCPADVNANCDAIPGLGEATATDYCDTDPRVTSSDDTLSFTCPLEISRMWVATDDCGNADTCYQSIIVDDTTAPVISCPTDRTFECDAIGAFGTATATDNCDTSPTITLIDTDTIPGSCESNYQIVRTFEAMDDCGNADTCAQTITIQDTTPPVISCPPDKRFECDNVGAFGDATATDNCDATPTITYSDDTTSVTCPLQINRMWVAVDDCGNADTCYQSITIDDTTPPVISCPTDRTFECDNIGAFGTATATDNCTASPSVNLVDTDTIPGSCESNYQITRMFVATDDCGNADTCIQTITIQDTTPPVVTCPADVNANCDAIPGFGEATATDNCDATPTVTSSDDTLSTVCPLQISRMWVATDDCGNADTCYQSIIVDDTTAPVITCPTDRTFECDAIGAFGTATATDNCDTSPTITLIDTDTIPGSCASNYQIVRTFEAMDDCGNADTCAQTITIQDTTPPVITCPADTSFECDAIGDFGSASATDNCDSEPTVAVASVDTVAGSCPSNYQIVRTFVATDACGNADTCQQTITIEDTTPPEITCAAQDTIGCEDELNWTPATATDNCDADPLVEMVSVDTTAGPGAGEFTYTSYWTATDTCGNVSDTCNATIIRLDCPDEFCTYTMGGWGNTCPDSQADDMMSTQPGCIRDHYFAMVFPSGVTIGDPAGVGGGAADRYAIHFSSAAAVRGYLPAGGSPKSLKHDYTNPTSTDAGVLAGQILALTLNREYSCAGVFATVGLTEGASCYGSYVIGADCGKFAGLTVDQFLLLANAVLSGDKSVLTPYEAGVGDVNETATCLNELYNNCDPNSYPRDLMESQAADEEPLPFTYGLVQNYPNPFNPTTEISFTLPSSQHVMLEIFNVVGQRVAVLVNGMRTAGRHTVQWDATAQASGMYFYRIQASEFVETKKMLLLK